MVATEGLPPQAVLHTADIQDRDDGMLVLYSLFGLFPFLAQVFADGGCQRPKFRQAIAKALPMSKIEIVKRADMAGRFAVLAHLWVVERAFGSTLLAAWPWIWKICIILRWRISG